VNTDGGVNAAMVAASAATSAAASRRGMITLRPTAAGKKNIAGRAFRAGPNRSADDVPFVSEIGIFL
jgi:hypothetical protein